jgi:hypothetical protein
MKCETCPVPGATACEGEFVPRFCALAKTREDYRHLLLKMAGIAGTSAKTAINPHMERLFLVWSCDYRGGPVDECACTGQMHCGLGQGTFRNEPFAVSTTDCLRCVSRSEASRSRG